MKTIGLIGGMSWESTDVYYQTINRMVRDRLGGLHSADIIMHSLDFEEINALQRNGRWDIVGSMISVLAENMDSECVLICSVTGHNQVVAPILHIADCVNKAIEDYGKVGLLGTIYTMEMDYFKSKLNADVIVPNKEDRQKVNSIIYDEISQGIFKDGSRFILNKIIQGLKDRGAEAVILGCTELPILVKEADIPVIDSVKVHCEKAVQIAIEEEQIKVWKSLH